MEGNPFSNLTIAPWADDYDTLGLAEKIGGYPLNEESDTDMMPAQAMNFTGHYAWNFVGDCSANASVSLPYVLERTHAVDVVTVATG